MTLSNFATDDPNPSNPKPDHQKQRTLDYQHHCNSTKCTLWIQSASHNLRVLFSDEVRDVGIHAVLFDIVQIPNALSWCIVQSRQSKRSNADIVIRLSSMFSLFKIHSAPREDRRFALDHLQPFDNHFSPATFLVSCSTETQIALAFFVVFIAEHPTHSKA